MPEADRPPVPGNWERTMVSNTGPWTIGPIWIDRAAESLCLQVQPEHCNGLQSMHGGAMATFMDAQAVAVMPAIEGPRQHTPTISLHVDYLAPPRAGEWLVMNVDLVKQTRTMIFTQCVARVGDRAMARSHAIYRTAIERTSS